MILQQIALLLRRHRSSFLSKTYYLHQYLLTYSLDFSKHPKAREIVYSNTQNRAEQKTRQTTNDE